MNEPNIFKISSLKIRDYMSTSDSTSYCRMLKQLNQTESLNILPNVMMTILLLSLKGNKCILFYSLSVTRKIGKLIEYWKSIIQ